jgi:hypothetical protein
VDRANDEERDDADLETERHGRAPHPDRSTKKGMNRFITETSEYQVKSPADKATGKAKLYTEISSRGNHLKGPVPVSIHYVVKFTPDEEYWGVSRDDPNERYPWNTERRFDTGGERDSYFASHSETIVELKKE